MQRKSPSLMVRSPRHWPRLSALLAIRLYQLTLSALIGRRCRYLPTCSDYTGDAIAAHGLWGGGWMGLARICRCHPWGGSGFDPPADRLPEISAWYRPWRYGQWRPMRCESVQPATPQTD
jgi:putative membrane protein insertion efficiency factor